VKYLVDSDWLIDALAGVPIALATVNRLSDEGLAVAVVSLGEIFEGAFGADDTNAQLAIMRHFLSDFVVVPLSDPILESFARIRSLLRKQGRLIPDLDLQIAATAVTLDLILLTRNQRHFGRVPGLELYENI
jgi:predicted nucleic acid-binding protein